MPITKKPSKLKCTCAKLNPGFAASFFILVSWFSCHSGNSIQEFNNDGILQLTPEKVKKMGLKLSSLSTIVIFDTLSIEGFLESSVQNKTRVTVPLASNLKKLNINNGSYVTKGQILGTLEHQNILLLQQAFLEARSDYQFQRIEYMRQSELSIENANSLKKQQLSKNEYDKAEVRYISLYQQIKLIGLNPDSLYSENISPAISLFAPKSGYIQYLEVEIGKYYQESDPLFVINNITNNYFLVTTNSFPKDGSEIPDTLYVNLLNQLDNKNTAILIHSPNLNSTDEKEISYWLTEEISPNLFQNTTTAVYFNPKSVTVLEHNCLIKLNHKYFIIGTYDSLKYQLIKVETNQYKGNLIQINADIKFTDMNFKVVSNPEVLMNKNN